MESNAGVVSTGAEHLAHDATAVSTRQRIVNFFKKVAVKLVKTQKISDKGLSTVEYHTDYHTMHHITRGRALRAFNVPNSLMAAVINQHRKFESLFSGNWSELLAQDNRIGAFNLVNFFALHPKVLKAIEEIIVQPPRFIDQRAFNNEDYYFIKRIFEILGGTWEMDYEQTVFAQEHSHEVCTGSSGHYEEKADSFSIPLRLRDDLVTGTWCCCWRSSVRIIC